MPKYAVFVINGLPEKDFLGTAVIAQYKKENPNQKIIVLSRNPYIWMHNTDVWRIYDSSRTQYFHDDFIAGGQSKIFAEDPYISTDYISHGMHVIDAWAKLIGVAKPEHKPKVFLTQREFEVTERLLGQYKPFCIISTEGEAFLPKGASTWVKKIPRQLSEFLASEMKKSGINVLHAMLPNEQPLPFSTPINFEPRILIGALKAADARILTNSFLAHASAALEINSTVIYSDALPLQTGYEINSNFYPENLPPQQKDIVENYYPAIDVGNFRSLQRVNLAGTYKVEAILKSTLDQIKNKAKN